jgi:hypothetical protein
MSKSYNDILKDIGDSIEILNVLIEKSNKDNYDLLKIYQNLEKYGTLEKSYLNSLDKSNQTKDHTKRMIEILYAEYDNRYGTNWGWCSLNKAGCIIDCINDLYTSSKKLTCVEIGVYGGKSVLPVVLELKRLKLGVMHAIDPWDNIEATKGYTDNHYDFWKSVDLENIYNIFNYIIKENDCEQYVKIYRTTSDEAPIIDDIDFLYIDGQHTDQALKDAEKYANNVNIGGYCIADDIVHWWADGAIEKLPSLLENMGFEICKKVDMAIIFKRVWK